LGGFDEHPSFRGYLCGPYDLGWRLVNAGVPEVWHDERVALWHFAHPDPPATFGQSFSWKLWREVAHPHADHHALTAVEAFSTGRLLPLRENPQVHALRMSFRQIGTEFEKKYATMTSPSGFSKPHKLGLRLALLLEPPRLLARNAKSFVTFQLLMALKKLVGPETYDRIKAWWHSRRAKSEASGR